MAMCNLFPVIDLPATGRSIEKSRKAAGLSVRDVQNYFGFEYPQAVYKWQHGECLPSVDNLLALSRLLRVRMEDLLVYEDQEVPLIFWGKFFHIEREYHKEGTESVAVGDCSVLAFFLHLGMRGLPPKPTWGFHPQTPSSLRAYRPFLAENSMNNKKQLPLPAEA